MNKARILLGGLLAGLVVNVGEAIVHGVLLVKRDAEMMTRLHLSAEPNVGAIVALNVWGFAVGMLTILLYASIRPRMGAGPGTAVRAGIFAWAGASALASAVPGIMGIYQLDLVLINVGLELIVFVLAALAGAAVYKEEANVASSAAAA